MGMLAKAASKAATTADTKKKERTVWMLHEGDPLIPVVEQFLQLDKEEKAAKSRKDLPKGKLRTHCRDLFVSDYVAQDKPPETPMVLMCPNGQSVTYVSQDRTKQHEVSDSELEALGAVLGVDKAAKLVYNETEFAFSRELMERDEVANAIDKALTACVKKLVDSKALTEAESEMLLVATVERHYRPRVLTQMTDICGKDVATVKQVLDIMGTGVTNYVKS